jgi:hypothetical protein
MGYAVSSVSQALKIAFGGPLLQVWGSQLKGKSIIWSAFGQNCLNGPLGVEDVVVFP